MKKTGNVVQGITANMDLHTASLPHIPLIEIASDRRVLVENHKGITQYGSDRIAVRVSYGTVYITGSNLELAQMTKQQLVVTGCIDCVTLCRGGNV